MLQVSVSECSDQFRLEIREWLEKNPPPSVSLHSKLEIFIDHSRQWQRRLAEAGFVGVSWPEKYGGRSLTLVEEAVVQEELGRVQAPQLLGLFGLTMVGPVLIRHGSEAQRERYLRNILDASEIWSQGFSEPGAGSDLAAIRTRAVSEGDAFRISGQKVWTSFAQISDWCFLLCRTSDEEKKHRGLTYFLVDMKSEGITTRPLKQITGDEEFNEVFFDNLLVPSENVVGEVGEGWEIAITTLMYERVILTFARQLQSESCLRDLLERRADIDESGLRELGAEVAEACAIRALAYEHLAAYSGGEPPGPEGSLDKLLWSESFQRIAKLCLRVSGAEAGSGEADEIGGDAFARKAVHRYLYSRGRSIAAGTSEIQRNIIAERVLGLPRLRYSRKARG